MPNVFIPAVELSGVHQDYADKIVRWTKNYMKDKASFVDDASLSEYTLQISLVKESSDAGVVVSYKLLNSRGGAVVWSYSSMAYNPQDFFLAVNAFVEKFGKWNGFKFGVGIGTMGFPIDGFQVAPALDLSIHYMFDRQFVTLNLNSASDFEDLFNYGAFLSFAHEFDFRNLFPYIGAGAGASLTEYDADGTMINADVSVLAKGGLIFRLTGSSNFYVLEMRFTYNVLKSLYVENTHGDDVTDEHSPASFGLFANLQVWW